MTSKLLPLFLLLGALHGFCDVLLYKSNEFGMALQRIEPYKRDESKWVLEIKRDGKNEVRRLYDNGKEARRWEVSWTGSETRKVESELTAGVLSARRAYDALGTLLEEEQYEAGTLSQKSVFTYAGGRLSRMKVTAADGSVRYTEKYVYGRSGTLREVRRTGAGGDVRVSTYVSGSAGVSEERTAGKDTLFITRYDTQGRVASREVRKLDQTLSQEEYHYRPDSDLLLSSTERLPKEVKIIERRYDEAGKLLSEVSTANGAVVEESTYARDDQGRETARTRRSALGLETWKYSHSEDGKVTREEYFRLGSLQKITNYGQGKLRTEELYKNEELFLKVYYDGDARLKEEVYAGGKLIRERKYG